MKIDFVSDVSCPWCAIVLQSLLQAAQRLGDEVPLELHFQPFELNPQMAPEGQEIVEHLTEKYRISPEQVAQNTEAIRQRGAALGFDFRMGARSRIYNTFDAHRLLHWAGLQGGSRQLALKQGLLSAYFTQGENPGAHEVLLRVASEAGLDVDAARQVLQSDAYAAEVREAEQHYQAAGIHSVPAVIINDKHLISGGQPPEVFERALRQLAAAPAG